MVLCIGTTPAVQRVMVFNSLKISAVNRAVEVVESAAGKSVNVAKVIRVLGEAVVATGFLGGPRGRFVSDILRAMGARVEFVEVAAETRMCVTVVDRSAGTHTELVEESATASAREWNGLLEKIVHLIPRSRFVALSGTIAPGGPADLYAQCVRMSREANVPVLVDATADALKQAIAEKPTVVKINRGELAGAVNMTLDSPESIVKGMRRAVEMGAGKVAVTLGGNGAMACDGKDCWRITIPKIDVVNTIGSGDAFTGGLAKGLLDGKSFEEACRLGSACGVANALTLMAGEIHVEDVQRLLPQVGVEELRT